MVYAQSREWDDAIANRSVMTRTYFRDHLEPLKERIRVIDQAYQYQRQTGEEVMRLMDDRSLTREQREGVVQQLTGEYDQKLRALGAHIERVSE